MLINKVESPLTHLVLCTHLSWQVAHDWSRSFCRFSIGLAVVTPTQSVRSVIGNFILPRAYIDGELGAVMKDSVNIVFGIRTWELCL